MIRISSYKRRFRKAYVCSPLSADSKIQIKRNMENAKKYVAITEVLLNCKAVAPHAILPEILDDNIPAERELALAFGLDLLSMCDCVVVFGNIISKGMQVEINKAKELGINVIYASITTNDISTDIFQRSVANEQ